MRHETREETFAPSSWLNPKLFEGKVAFVTGGGSGIGEAAARMLAQHGCAVAVADKRLELAQTDAASIERSCGSALAVGVDVSDDAQVVAAIARVVAWRDGLDIVVNNAAVALMGNLAEVDLQVWRTSFEVNVVGSLLAGKKYQEYRDGAVLRCLGIPDLPGRQLADFWPR